MADSSSLILPKGRPFFLYFIIFSSALHFKYPAWFITKFPGQCFMSYYIVCGPTLPIIINYTTFLAGHIMFCTSNIAVPSCNVILPELSVWRPHKNLILKCWFRVYTGLGHRCAFRCHYDVTQWRRLLRYRPFAMGIHRWPMDSPHKGPVAQTLMFSLMIVQTNSWIIRPVPGDLRRHCAHCDVIIMALAHGCVESSTDTVLTKSFDIFRPSFSGFLWFRIQFVNWMTSVKMADEILRNLVTLQVLRITMLSRRNYVQRMMIQIKDNKPIWRSTTTNTHHQHTHVALGVHAASLWWRHNERDGVSNHQPHDCLLNRLFRCRSKKNLKAPRHWPLCGEFTGDWWIPRTNGQ